MNWKTITCGLRPLLALGAAGMTACDPAASSAGAAGTPTSVLRIRPSLHSRLVENSIAVTSVSRPGVVFGLNDSGHRPELFAFDSTGRHLAMWRVAPASNVDWEAAAVGPCAVPPASCLYLGDVGDNDGRRDQVTIYRVTEPVPTPGAQSAQLRPERIRAVYPGHPHDVEAMYVGPDGSVFLLTKRRLLDAARRPRPTLIFRVPASAWDSGAPKQARAELVDSLPIYPGSAPGRQVTDAALSRDGRRLAVRTYREIYVFAMNPATARPSHDVPPALCMIGGLRERQGEGIGWWWDGRRLLLTSEGPREDLIVVECPLPD